MNIDQYGESEIANGNEGLLDITKTTGLKKRIQPMGKQEIITFKNEFIETIAGALLSSGFIKSLSEVFVKKQIEVGILDKSERVGAVMDLIEEIKQHNKNELVMLIKDHQTYIITQNGHSFFVANFIVTKRKIATNSKGIESQEWTVEFLDQNSQKVKIIEIPITVKDRSKPIYLQEKIGMKFSDVRISMDFDLFNKFISQVLNRDHVPIERYIVRNSYGLHELNKVPFVLYQSVVSTDYGVALKDAILSPEENQIRDVVYDGSLENCLYCFPKGESHVLAKQLEILLNSYPKMITKSKALSILGWFLAATIKKQISDTLKECYLPILNLYSKPGVGKSVTVTALARALGYAGPRDNNSDDANGGATGKEYLFGLTTIPTIRELLASHNNMPVIIGEFRSDQKHSSQFENLILGAFDGMGGAKMRSVNNEHKIHERPLIAPLVLMGNDRLVDDASQSRLLLIHLLEKDKDQTDNKAHMDNLLSLGEGYCGSAIYSWLVNNWGEVKEIILKGADLASKFTNGPHRLNAASTCVAIGLMLLRRIAMYYQLDVSMISDGEIQKTIDFIQKHVGENVNETLDRKFIYYVVERLQNNPKWFKVVRDEIILDTKWISDFHGYLYKHKASSVNLNAISTLLKKELPDIFTVQKRAMNGSNTQERLVAKIDVLVDKYDLEKDSFTFSDPLLML